MNKKQVLTAVICGAVLYSGWAEGPIFFARAEAAQSVSAEVQAKVKTVTAVVDCKSTKTSEKHGIFHCSTVQAALDHFAKVNAKAAVLQIAPGTYREKITIRQPNLTLIGMGKDASAVTIVFNDAEGTPLRPGDVQSEGKATYTMDCATVLLTKDAKNFQAQNITFANDFPTEQARAEKKIKSVQAFAIRDEADQSSFWNCRFIGRQDTVYANAGREYYKDCYIEGDVDFIFGQADAVFEACEIKALKRNGTNGNVGYITAPSTLEKDKGYLFYQCHITSDVAAPNYYMLGRPWHPSSEKRPVNSAAVFRECQLDLPLKEKGWNSMGNKYGVFQPEDNRLFEYGSKGPGALVSANRRQISSEKAAEYLPAIYLGDWTPKKSLIK